ncbi:MAG: hypothetical protein SVV80_04245 [Planctomycetota bacterium]|nr:hypothetical protein [Planctomycetota bacterium]
MALGFFRRRQKMVLLVMVVLMVAFLMPTLFQGLGRGRDRDAVIGYVNDEKVTIRMQQSAEVDLALLSRSLGMGMGRRTGEGAFAAFRQINSNQNAGLTWMLLLHEAGRMDITIRQNQVESLLAESGLIGEAYRRELANLRENRYTEEHLRRAVANYLMVTTAFETAQINTTPSIPELRHAFGDLRERIGLAMVAFPAKDFTADVPEPSEEAVLRQFERYRHLFAQGPENKTDFGFGYRVPNRLDVAWLFIDEDIVARAVEPRDDNMMDYWNEHRGELKKRIPVPTTSTAPSETQPSETQPSETQPSDTEPAEPAEEKFREVPFESFSQAKPKIRQVFMPGAINAGMSDIASLARGTIRQFADSDDPYAAAVKAMIHPADAILDRKVGTLPFAEASIEAVIEELEELAKVKIVFPFGKHEKFTLDKKVVVRIKPWGDISLGEALKRIGEQAKCPPVKWVTCDGLSEAIFASEPVNLVPISAGRTGMTGFTEIYRNELLGRAGLKSGTGPGGQSLLSIAATAEVFQQGEKKHSPLIKPGGDFDRVMYVSGQREGRLLWRLVQAQAAHAPTHPDQEIRKQVIDDLKTVAGFKKALAAAEAMKIDLEKTDGDLEKLAKADKRQVVGTGLFSRKTLDTRTGQIFFSSVGEIGQDRQFITTAFTLIPSDPDKPGEDKPAAVIPLRRQAKVMLVRRTEYEPVKEADFEGLVVGRTIVEVPRQDEEGKITIGYGLRDITLDEVLMHRLWAQTALVWFSNQSVIKRVNFRPEYPSD